MGDSEDIKNLLQTIVAQNEEIKCDIAHIKAELSTQINKIQEINNTVNYLEKENQDLKRKLLISEKRLKRNNVVIFGVSEETQDIQKFIITLIQETIQVPFGQQEVNNIFRIGVKSDDKKRPILLELVSNLKKQQIFQKLGNLKGTRISFSNDLTPEERREQSLLYQHLKTARQKHYNAKIVKNKLIVNGEAYTYETLRTKNSESSQPARIVNPNSAPNTPIEQNEILFDQILKKDKLIEPTKLQETIYKKKKETLEADRAPKTPETSGSGTKVKRNNLSEEKEHHLRSKKLKI